MVLEMHDFDVILGMDWLAGHHASMDCYRKMFTFKLEDIPSEVKFQGEKKITLGRFISVMSAAKLLRNGCEGFIAYISEEEQFLGVESIPVVREFPNVFPEEIPGLPPVREVEFTIELTPGTAPKIHREIGRAHV